LAEAPSHLTMPVEEIRARLDAARKYFPLRQIAKIGNFKGSSLLGFIAGRTPKKNDRFGPMRLRRLAKICLDIETGALRHNGKMVGRGSKAWADEPIRPPVIVHRVMFGRSGSAPKLVKGETPDGQKMPSFATLFAGKPAIRLPKLSFKR